MFSVWILRHWIIYIFDISNYNNYFLNMKIYFDNNFTLIYSFTCFFYKISITLLVSKSLSKMAHSDEKTSGCFHFSLSFTVLFMIDRTTAQIEWWERRPTTEVWRYFHYNIYVFGPLFVKLANYFNLNCLSPTFVEEKVFPMEHMKLKVPSIKPVIAGYIFCL